MRDIENEKPSDSREAGEKSSLNSDTSSAEAGKNGEDQPNFASKSSPSSSEKFLQCKRAAQIKMDRWDKALRGVCIEVVLEELGLKEGSKVVCPFCGAEDSLSLDREDSHFRCRVCKKEGSSVSLVKKVRNVTDWKAVLYLEELGKAGKEEELDKEEKRSDIATSASPGSEISVSSVDHDSLVASGSSPVSAPGAEVGCSTVETPCSDLTPDVSKSECLSESSGVSEEVERVICPVCHTEDSLSISGEKGFLQCSECGEKVRGEMLGECTSSASSSDLEEEVSTESCEESSPSMEAGQSCDAPREGGSLEGKPERSCDSVAPGDGSTSVPIQPCPQEVSLPEPLVPAEVRKIEASASSPEERKDSLAEEVGQAEESPEHWEVPEHEEGFKERIERVKAANRIEDVIERQAGVVFKKVGSNLACRCPFSDHEDKHPSFMVRPDRQLFKCFGCGRKGDVISFMRQYRSIRFQEALNLLDPMPEPTQTAFSSLSSDSSSSVRRYRLVKRIRDFFHKRLLESQAGQEFLKSRGLFDPKLVEYFQIGFDDGQINRALTADVIADLAEMGILNDKKHSRFYQCITVGLEDAEGNVVSLYGRRINTDKGSKHQFPRGAVEGVFNAKAFKVYQEMILTEGIVDGLSVWVMGFCNISSIFSASSIPGLLVDLLARFGVKVVYMAFDNDKAGDAACVRFAKAVAHLGVELRRIKLPEGIKDANELLMKYGREKASECFRELIAKAEAFHNEVAQGEAREAQCGKREVVVQKQGEDIEIRLGNKVYRVRGLYKNLSYEIMKVNIRVSLGEKFYLDTLDMYNARHRQGFEKASAEELEVSSEEIHKELGQVLIKLEELQDAKIQATLKPAKPEIKISAAEEAEAMELLKDPRLLDRIAEDYRSCGLVGEETNVKVGHLCGLTREFDDPIPVIFQSASAAGKSALMDAILDFIPPEKKVKYTAMTGQSLFYMGETDLKHKTLAITEQEGAEEATYALKIMESEKELKIATTGKDPKTGKLITNEYRVEGPAQNMFATTAAELEEEFQNRGIVLTANESRKQTQEIHKQQRESETLQGVLWQRQREKIIKLEQNAQRLLRPLLVVNPYATKLTFLDTQLRTRRDHKKYLTLIRAIAYLYQYQRQVKEKVVDGHVVQYMEVTLADIEIANELVSHVMGVSLDELAPQTRRLLGLIYQMVQGRCQKEELEQRKCLFTRKAVRDYTGWGDTQLKVHLERLVDMEYIVIRSGGLRQRHFYELLYKGEGADGKRFCIGLLDVAVLRKQLEDKTSHGSNANVGEVSTTGRG